MSNNPFAFALNEPNSYVHHRDPPSPPSNQTSQNFPISQVPKKSSIPHSKTSTNNTIPPPRPPKVHVPPPPSYEEAAGKEAKNGEYPDDKPPRSRTNSNPSRDQKEKPREHRHRERRSRSESDRRERSSRSKKDSGSPKKEVKPVKAKNLDTIDKLDVTGFFGGGFHHDGPFDACTPHRNKNAKQPPVLAFPADGPNNAIGGLQNVDKDQQINLAFGTYNDDDQNEIMGRRTSIKEKGFGVPLIKTPNEFDQPLQNPSVMAFDANSKSVPVHGSTTAGLGSTTFIDGAPAPVRVGSNEERELNSNGLGRKKSFAERLRKTSSPEAPRRNSNDSDNGKGYLKVEEPSSNSFIRRVKSLKVRR